MFHPLTKSNVIDARIVNLVRITSAAGEGTEGDPVREIIEYYTPEGEFVAIRDMWADEQFKKMVKDKEK